MALFDLLTMTSLGEVMMGMGASSLTSAWIPAYERIRQAMFLKPIVAIGDEDSLTR